MDSAKTPSRYYVAQRIEQQHFLLQTPNGT